MIRILLAVLFTVGAMQSFDLGMAWINEGHGLHPFIAFGAVFFNIFGILCLLAYAYIVKNYPEIFTAIDAIHTGINVTDAEMADFHKEAAAVRAKSKQ